MSSSGQSHTSLVLVSLWNEEFACFQYSKGVKGVADMECIRSLAYIIKSMVFKCLDCVGKTNELDGRRRLGIFRPVQLKYILR